MLTSSTGILSEITTGASLCNDMGFSTAVLRNICVRQRMTGQGRERWRDRRHIAEQEKIESAEERQEKEQERQRGTGKDRDIRDRATERKEKE